jgi:hypothetical protein
MLKAITRQAQRIDASLAARNERAAATGAPPATLAQFFDLHATPEDVAVTVSEPDFAAARAELVPSVSVDELAHYERVRRAFEGAGTGPGGGPAAAAAVDGPASRSPPPQSPGSPPPPLRLSLGAARGLALPGKALSDQRGSLGSARTRRSDRSTFYFDREQAAAAAEEQQEEDGPEGEDVGDDARRDGGGDTGDEYLIRTEHLASGGAGGGAASGGGAVGANGSMGRGGGGRGNGHVGGHHAPSSHEHPPRAAAGKGKGKSRTKGLGFMRAAFGGSAHGDEELYK